MATLKSIATDVQKEVEGIWVTYPNSDFELKIARLKTAECEAHVRKLMKPYRSKHKNLAKLGEWDMMQVIAPAVAAHVVKDWRGLTQDVASHEEVGVAIPYSQVECLKMFQDPAYRDLYSFVLETAGDSDEYRAELFEEGRGN